MSEIKDGAGGFGSDNFIVYDIKGNPVAAKYLVDSSGNYVMNSVTGTPLVVPADYDPNQIIQTFTSQPRTTHKVLTLEVPDFNRGPRLRA